MQSLFLASRPKLLPRIASILSIDNLMRVIKFSHYVLCYCQIAYHKLLDCKANSVQKTDYGRPMKPFSTEIQNFWAWADK